MATLVQQMRKFIELIEGGVSDESQNLRYCFFDISTTTSVGESGIRIYPKEGRNKYFTNANRDIGNRLVHIDEIINEAKKAGSTVRIVITRQSDFDKRLTRYISSTNDKAKIFRDILHEVDELADQIKS